MLDSLRYPSIRKLTQCEKVHIFIMFLLTLTIVSLTIYLSSFLLHTIFSPSAEPDNFSVLESVGLAYGGWLLSEIKSNWKSEATLSFISDALKQPMSHMQVNTVVCTKLFQRFSIVKDVRVASTLLDVVICLALHLYTDNQFLALAVPFLIILNFTSFEKSFEKYCEVIEKLQ